MPWKASSVMEERLRFVGRLLDGESMSDVCREFGISFGHRNGLPRVNTDLNGTTLRACACNVFCKGRMTAERESHRSIPLRNKPVIKPRCVFVAGHPRGRVDVERSRPVLPHKLKPCRRRINPSKRLPVLFHTRLEFRPKDHFHACI